MSKRFEFFFWICLLLSASCQERSSPAFIKETRMLMGTVVSIELSGEDPAAVLEVLWEEAARLEGIFSSYDSESELSRINRKAFRHPIRLSPEMEDVLREAGRIGELTGGALDITIGPLMELWGFFPVREGNVPSREEIESAREKVNWSSIELGEGTVRFARSGLEVDLAALAKGYVVDRLADLARKKGVKDALINAGGDLSCLGERPGGGGWRIGVEHPRRPGEVFQVLSLSNRAVATSGDYRNYFIESRNRYFHIIDPRTGRPAQTGVAEVTVIAPRCVTADALATAVFVLGAEEGIGLLNRMEGVEGLIVTEREGKVDTKVSRNFPD